MSFGAAEGSIHGLIGENGAGKSTLLKTLSGVHPPTDGTIRIAGQPRRFANTADALAAGVAVIYQELHLVPEMTVAENLYLGQFPATCGVVDRARLLADARARLKALGEDIAPATKVRRLPIAQRQMIEIAKALSRGAKIIAFDEPTSSLSARETERLFETLGQLKAEGKVIFYVSHRMDEIFRVCDAVTVLRDGRHVGSRASLEGVTTDDLVKSMVGRDITDVYGYRTRERGDCALEVRDVRGPGLNDPVSFSVARGEILGVFGLVGAGRSELLKLIYGANRKSGGAVAVFGRQTDIRRPKDAIRAGLMFCPEDRKQEGIVPIRSVMENLNLSARRHHTRLGFIINHAWEARNAREHIDRLTIRTPSPRQLIVNLSGGNQQKVILARWLSEQTRVLLMDEPTRGIDVGAKREIYDLMYDLADQGIGLVIVSSDLPEVLGISDRIMVMRQGRVSGFLDRKEADSERVLNKTGSVFVGFAGGLVIGTAVGLVNGLVIAKLKINALITTLAMMQIVRGLAFIFSPGGVSVSVTDERFFVLGNTRFLAIPTPVWITLICFGVFGLLLQYTTFGRNTLAVGGNEEAARLAGIPVDRIKITIFTMQGAMAAFAGIVMASRMTSGQPNVGLGFELAVISACVLGGVSLTGGVGNMLFVISGVLIMGIVQNAMNLLNVPTFYQYVVSGTILLAAVILDRLKQRT